MNRDLWLAALAQVAPLPEFHEDAITLAEFAKLAGLRRSAAQERMAALVKAGKARRVSKPAVDCCGRRVVLPAYVLTKETPCATPPRATRKRSTARTSTTRN